MSNEKSHATPDPLDDDADELALIPKGIEGLTDEMMDSFLGASMPSGWTCLVGTCN
ncbi:MAG: hypothetical protein JWM53_903 [bacterium]|nr:hypothetical protein [bacterium]